MSSFNNLMAYNINIKWKTSSTVFITVFITVLKVCDSQVNYVYYDYYTFISVYIGPNHGGLRSEEVSVFEMFWVLMVQGEDLRVCGCGLHCISLLSVGRVIFHTFSCIVKFF